MEHFSSDDSSRRYPRAIRQILSRKLRHYVFVGLYRGPASVVTIDSWSQLFRRLKKERLESWGGKTSFPDIYFCLSKGPGTNRRLQYRVILRVSLHGSRLPSSSRLSPHLFPRNTSLLPRIYASQFYVCLRRFNFL